jgi:hypothetical protein
LKHILLLAAFLTAGCTFLTPTPTSRLYRDFSAQSDETLLPDYSYAGYHQCEKPLPTVSRVTHRFLDVADFGAVPDDGKSDRDAVLDALKAAHAYTGPAAIVFPAGRFRLNERSDIGKPPITLTRSNLVLKGAGAALSELFFSEPAPLGTHHVSISAPQPDGSYWRGTRTSIKVLSNSSPDGFSVEVNDASTLTPGMIVNVDAGLNVNLEKAKGYFAPHAIPDGPRKRHGGRNDYMFEIHRIAAVEGNRVTFAEPIHLDLPHIDNIVLWTIDHTIEECGVEGVTLAGNYRGLFKHHAGPRYGEDYRMLTFDNAFNCWGNDLRFTDYSKAIRMLRSGFNTVTNALLEGNPGHSSITIEIGYGNLFAYIREQNDTHHGLGVVSSATNTVFLRCTQYKSMEAHCRWARATLYDLNEGGFQTRGGGATFTPMHGRLLCFWNWHVTRPGDVDFWPVGKRYGYFMPPIVAGLHGLPIKVADTETDLRAWESPGRRVVPESLFETQLSRRTGSVPDWLRDQSRLFERISRHSRIAITTPHHSAYPFGTAIPIGLATPARCVREIELVAGNRNEWDGLEVVAAGRRPCFRAPSPGAWILKARLTNTRGEIATSRPITIYVGDPQALQSVPIARAAAMLKNSRSDLYRTFTAVGGGEGTIASSSALERRSAAKLHTWQIATDYECERQELYRSFGPASVLPMLNDPEQLGEAAKLIDNDTATTVSIYNWLETMAQFDLGVLKAICRVDLVWRDAVPEKDVRLELQTATDERAWTSVVNDEPIWESCVARLGSTLIRDPLPRSAGNITSLYFPERPCRYVRLLFTNFPNEALAEIRVFGPGSR